jgi:hypothetical protein
LYAAGVPFGERTPRKFFLEVAAVVAVVGIAAFLIWWFNRPAPIHDVRPLGGRNVNITRNSRAQWAPSAALDPADPRTMLGGSIDELQDTRVYASTDGGATWTSRAQPALERANCNRSDPAVAIGPSHLELYAFLASAYCRPLDPHIRVGWRRGSSGAWHVTAPPQQDRGFVFDQRPTIAAGPGGAVLAWLRFVGATNSDNQRVLVSRSTDGRTWSAPLRLPFQAPYLASVAIAPDGDVYLAVADSLEGVVVLRSRDGGRTFGRPHRVAALRGVFLPTCGHGDVMIPAQPQRCVGPSPAVSADRDRVLLTFARPDADGTMTVEAAVLDRRLHVRRLGAVAPREDGLRDEFTPASTIDRATGDLWVCFYDTTGDETRKHAWFTCTVSDDGGRTWAPPVHAASARSNETRFSAGPDGYGDVQAVVAAGGVAHPLWTDSRKLENSEEIYTARLKAADLLRRNR